MAFFTNILENCMFSTQNWKRPHPRHPACHPGQRGRAQGAQGARGSGTAAPGSRRGGGDVSFSNYCEKRTVFQNSPEKCHGCFFKHINSLFFQISESPGGCKLAWSDRHPWNMASPGNIGTIYNIGNYWVDWDHWDYWVDWDHWDRWND